MAPVHRCCWRNAQYLLCPLALTHLCATIDLHSVMFRARVRARARGRCGGEPHREGGGQEGLAPVDGQAGAGHLDPRLHPREHRQLARQHLRRACPPAVGTPCTRLLQGNPCTRLLQWNHADTLRFGFPRVGGEKGRWWARRRKRGEVLLEKLNAGRRSWQRCLTEAPGSRLLIRAATHATDISEFICWCI